MITRQEVADIIRQVMREEGQRGCVGLKCIAYRVEKLAEQKFTALRSELERERREKGELAWEAFELGARFQFFIHGGMQCFDGRDLARFFGSDGHPPWSEAAGQMYQKRTTMTTPLATGVVIAKQCLREALRQAALTPPPAQAQEQQK